MYSRLVTPASRISSELQRDTFSRKRFDDRAQTWLSTPTNSPARNPKTSISSDYIDSFHQPSYNPVWKPSKITNIIGSENFRSTHGTVEVIAANSTFIAVGTSKGVVVGFNYHQQISFVTASTKESKKESAEATAPEEECAVSCLAFSSASQSIAAGYQNGSIRVWELPTSSDMHPQQALEPLYTIPPISLEDRFTRNGQGHLAVPITSILFESTLTTQLVASDISGLVFYHHLYKRLMKRGTTSVKLFGRNDANVVSESGNLIIHGCELLPLGSEYQITDKLAVFAVITSSMLAIVSILSLNNSSELKVRTHYTVGIASESQKRMSNGDGATSPTPEQETPVRLSSLNWLPSCRGPKGSLEGPKLIYTYNKTLTILQLDISNFASIESVLTSVKDKDKIMPSLIFTRMCRRKFSNEIDAARWITPDVFLLFAASEVCVCHYDMFRQKVKNVSEFSRSLAIQPQSYVHAVRNQKYKMSTVRSSIVIVKRNILVLAEHQIFFGSIPTWADVLVDLLAKQDYTTALSTALKYFLLSDVSEASVASLPFDANNRKGLVRPYMIRILREVDQILSNNNLKSFTEIFTNGPGVKKPEVELLNLCILTIKQLQLHSLEKDNFSYILDTLYNFFDDAKQFFVTLIPHCLDGSLLYLPPTILKSLVEYAVANEKGEVLTEIICSLDTQSLDIDLTLRLCSQYDLRECSIYIWTYVMSNYVHPLIEYINDYQVGDVERMTTVVTYMSFIFTGRQYPTDRLIDFENMNSAQDSIAKFLFSINHIEEAPTKDQVVYPYLYMFLTTNSFEMLSCLNEFFESPYLREDGTNQLSRQSIIDCLLDIYHSSDGVFMDLDWINLAIFIARNYSKYSQFIRLSESVLQKVVEDLCNCSEEALSYDCELALQSLLPHYEPPNETILISKLNNARFYNVLIGLYRAKGEYANALNAWCKSIMTSLEDMGQGSLATVLETAYQKSNTTTAKMDLKEVIRLHFKEFVLIDNTAFVTLNSQYSPSLHVACTELEDDLKYQYLHEMFSGEWNTQDIPDIRELMTEYISLLCLRAGSEVLPWIKQNSKYIVGDARQASKTNEILDQYEQTLAQVVLLLQEEKYSEAIQHLLASFEKDIQTESKVDSKDSRGEKLQVLADICDRKEELWLTVVERLISLSKHASEDGEAAHTLREYILFCFKQISDGSAARGDEMLIMKVLHRMIGTDSTTMSQFRAILGDVFISYSYEGTMSEIVLRVVNQDIQKLILVIRLHNLLGWSVNARSCASCAKVLTGSGIDPKNYDAYNLREYEKVWGGNETSTSFAELTIVIFNCQHSYHLQCLQKLGWRSGDPCVICKL